MVRGRRAPGDRWTEHDATSAMALTLYEESLCPGCAHPIAETTAPTADPNALDRTHHYVVPPPTRCHACDAIELRSADYDEAPRPSALRFHAVRIDDPPDDDHPDPPPPPEAGAT